MALSVDGANVVPGVPLFDRFYPSDYQAKPPLKAIEIVDGKLYAATANGVLKYDGAEWMRIELPGNSPATALASRDQLLYIGGYGTVGHLEYDAFGNPSYREWMHPSQTDQHLYGQIHAITPGKEAIYIQTDLMLKKLPFKTSDKIEVWPLMQSSKLFNANKKILVPTTLDSESSLPSDEIIKSIDYVPALFAESAIVTNSKDTIVLTPQGWWNIDGSRPVKLSELSPQVNASRFDPTTAIRLNNGDIAVGMNDGKIYFFDKSFEHKLTFAANDQPIIDFAIDNDQTLWAATESQVIRIQWPSPWTQLTSDEGLRGRVLDMAWFNESLWLATNRGLRHIDPMRGSHWHVWDDLDAQVLLPVESGLMIGHKKGLAIISNEIDIRQLIVDPLTSVSELLQSRFDPDLVYGIGDRALVRIRNGKTGWRLFSIDPLDHDDARSIVETKPGVIWLGRRSGGLERWIFPASDTGQTQRQGFASDAGLKIHPRQGSTVVLIDGKLIVSTNEEVYINDGDRFSSYRFEASDRIAPSVNLESISTPLGDFLKSGRTIWYRLPKEKAWKSMGLGDQPSFEIGRMRVNADGNFRIAGWEGLMQRKLPIGDKRVRPPLKAEFDQVLIREAGGKLAPADTTKEGKVMIQAGQGLKLRFGVPSLDGSPQFMYRVPGQADDWSEWTDRELLIRALPPGQHVLELRARLPSMRGVEPNSLLIESIPLWHQRIEVRLLFGLLIVIGIALLISALARSRMKLIEVRNRELEQRIIDRTRALEIANAQLSGLVVEDALTGVPNRRALDLALQREWIRCSDTQQPISVLMIDVDFFKRFNDTYGHLEGDSKLREIAQCLSSQHDPRREILARYGGEEFTMLLPGLDTDMALGRAEALRTAVAATVTNLTISIGVATVIADMRANPGELMELADQALYAAKRNGRNRVEASTGLI